MTERRALHQSRGTIQVHDFSGHPFQAELSRELAAEGLVVEHAFSSQYTSGKGRLERLPGDPETLSFRAIETPRRFEKYSPVARMRFERSFANTWIKQLTEQRPDVVIACNVPLFALHRFTSFARRVDLPYVLWHQDVFSLALGEELERKLPHVPGLPHPLVAIGSRYLTHLEKNVVRRARRVVSIDDAFVREYKTWGLDTEPCRRHSQLGPDRRDRPGAARQRLEPREPVRRRATPPPVCRHARSQAQPAAARRARRAAARTWRRGHPHGRVRG